VAQKLKLGILGMSEGNGHPYSWSAIFNGFDSNHMRDCPFPAIPEYLAKQRFPEDFLEQEGTVTHIYTQDVQLSKDIARASHIPNVVDCMEDMIGKVDAILLARDDAENHSEFAFPFIKSGLPIFIDKPFALSSEEANMIWSEEVFQNQIFTCSSLRYAKELQLQDADKANLGPIKYVEATTPKKWDTYAVHVIEPILIQFPDRGKLLQVTPVNKNGVHVCIVEWENLLACIKCTGYLPSPIKITYFGEYGNVEKAFSDSFNCFKTSLKMFVDIVQKRSQNIDRKETLEIVRIIEKGRL
jgi:hypothetical protein